MKRLPALVLILLLGCSKTEREPLPDAIEVSRLRPLGAQVATEMLTSMKGEMMAAIERGGLPAAVEYCSIKALPLTRELAENQQAPIEVKRASDRPRNPANAADAWEEKAIAHFRQAIASGAGLPADYVQKFERDGRDWLRYYKPLAAGALCLSCHGDPHGMDPALRETLAVRYPQDRSMDCREGDLRGVFRLEIPANGLQTLEIRER